MRPISLFIASSLDGFITGPSESLEWLFTDQDYGYTAFYDAIDAAIMGRKTFDLACTFERVPHAGKAKYVFTRHLGQRTFPTCSSFREIQRSLVVSYGRRAERRYGSWEEATSRVCCSTLILSMRSCSRFIPCSWATASPCSKASGNAAIGHWRSQRGFLRASYNSLTLVGNDATHRNPRCLSRRASRWAGLGYAPNNSPDPNKAHES